MRHLPTFGPMAWMLALALSPIAGPARGDILIPTGYTATPGEGTAQGGSYNYFDDTGRQLIDGVLGANAWDANLGNGPAYEWVGWKVANPTITFQFAAPVVVSLVQIGFNRAEGAGIYLPPTVTIAGTNYLVAGDALADGTRGFLNFNIPNVTGTSLTITLTDNDANRWIFADEVRFEGRVVPEPASLALTASGIACLAAIGLRARHRPRD
ncbi:MAG: hypothetical protein U0800_24205 [Isosphaeraceae bacterium]